LSRFYEFPAVRRIFPLRNDITVRERGFCLNRSFSAVVNAVSKDYFLRRKRAR